MTEIAAGGLALLLATEARLAERVAAAHAEAEGIREAARQAARAAEAGLEDRLAAEHRELAGRIEAERDAEQQRLEAAADLRCRQLRELRPEVVEALAREIVERVLTGEPGGGS